MNYEDDLKSLLIKRLELPQNSVINRDTRLVDCGLDSLDIMDMIIEIEDHYDILIENPHKIISFGDLLDLIQAKSNAELAQ